MFLAANCSAKSGAPCSSVPTARSAAAVKQAVYANRPPATFATICENVSAVAGPRRQLVVMKASGGSGSATAVSKNGRPRDVVLGVLGGGQLGRMMALAAANMGVAVATLDPADPAPAAVASRQSVGSFQDAETIVSFCEANRVDVLTVEIEHINVGALETVQQRLGVEVQPSPGTLRVIQDKYTQKLHFSKAGVDTADFMEVLDDKQAQAAADLFGFPFMLKSKRLAYDGKGNAVVKDAGALKAAVKQLGGYSHGLYAEKWAPFVKEVAVMVARSSTGEISSYPLVETVHKDSICFITEAPADVSAVVTQQARALAEKAISCLDGAGIFGVEMFVLPDGAVLLNEVAPRPHNSGHYTMDACATSQFEQHVRAVLGWPLGSCALLPHTAIMYNLLGEADGDDGVRAAHDTMGRAYATPGACVHWYDKAGCSPKRKIGHINIVAASRAEARTRLERVAPGAAAALEATGAAARDAGVGGGSAPEVAIIMGSDSDLPTMAPAAQMLAQFGIAAECTVVSAHRTPERMVDFARTAHKRGIKVIIAGAGGAAHLPGMVAAMTPLPVIGVPVKPAGAYLDGLDALLSIVQMPRGVPVATVAIGNATNAGLLAVRVLGSARPDLLQEMIDFQEAQRVMVEGKAARLEAVGWEEYLNKAE